MKDDIVQATLHALADLIPLLGAEVVIGTHRKHIFADTKPRVSGRVLRDSSIVKLYRYCTDK